jgi:hypothetical protein
VWPPVRPRPAGGRTRPPRLALDAVRDGISDVSITPHSATG